TASPAARSARRWWSPPRPAPRLPPRESVLSDAMTNSGGSGAHGLHSVPSLRGGTPVSTRAAVSCLLLCLPLATSRAAGPEPTDAAGFIERGHSWDAKGDYQRAIKDYTEALRLDPKNANAFARRGLARANTKDFVRAIEDFDEALKLDPKDTRTYYN